MAYKSVGEKELKTKYTADSLGYGKQMHLIPQGKLGVTTRVLIKDKVGIG